MNQKINNEDIYSQDKFKICSPSTTATFDNIDDYISQFLDLPVYQQIQQYSNLSNTYQNIGPISQKNNNKSDIKYEYTNSQSKKTVIKKSLFHNLQKHLVITLRNIIKLPIEEVGNNLTQNMWKIFMNSQNYTKNSLFILFGQFDETDEETQNLFYQYGYGEFIDNYSAKAIQEAQNCLRKLICYQLKTINLEQYIQKTRVKKKQQFYTYIVSFMKEINQGPLKRRISRNKSLQFTKKITTCQDSKGKSLNSILGKL